MDNLLSIIVPTRDREKYCMVCVEYMLSVFPEEVQFVIQDNSASDVLTEWYKKHKYANITYNHVYEPLSPIDNFNKAIELAKGKYIIFIGDDDIVLHNALDVVKWADSNNIESIAQKQNVSYIWPYEGCNGLLVVPYVPDSKTIYKYNMEECLIDYLKDGCCDNPRLYHLPSFYHGIIKRSVLEKIKIDTGNYLGGLSSDSYSSTALSFYVTNHVEINKIFTLPGACPTSTTMANLKKDHCGELSKTPHLKYRKNYTWHDMIPKYYSVQTIWSESVLQALKDTKNNTYYRYFSLEDEFARAYILNKTIRSLIVEKTEDVLNTFQINHIKFYIKGFFKALVYSLRRNCKRVYAHFFSREKVIRDIPAISDCVKQIPSDLLVVNY